MRRIILILFCVSVFLQVIYESPSSGQLINGDFSSGLSGWDVMGDVGVSNGGNAVLQTGGISGLYETSLSTDIVILGDTLAFKYYFDITGPDDIKYPDFPSYGPDFFQMTLDAGEQGYFDIPLAWNPIVGFVSYSMDISSILPGTMARLSFLLFDEDDGHRSVAGLDDISDPLLPLLPSQPLPEPGTLILLGGGLVGVFVCSRYRGGRRLWGVVLILSMIPIYSSTVYAELQETIINDKTKIEFTSPVFNTKTNTLTLNMAVTNMSDTTIPIPFKVVITGISSPDVTLSNQDGYTTEGMPFLNMDAYVGNAGLLSNEKSLTAKISFHNPKRVKFRWDQDVIAVIDMPVETGPEIYNICVTPGEFPAICEFANDNFDVKNPGFDRIQQNPMPEMYCYEQVRVYAFDYNDQPFKVMINGDEAFYNEDGFYYYSDLTLKHGHNTINAEVTNDTGVTTSREITLNIDSVPPVINIINLTDIAVVTLPEIVVNGSVDDPDINSIRMRKDFITSEDIPLVNGAFNTKVILSAGHNNLSLEAIDSAGNAGNYNLDIVRVLSEYGDISGRVYNSALGVPVSGAVIKFTAGNSISGTVVNNEDGTYRIQDVKSGDISILVEHDGYDPVNLKVFFPGGDISYKQDIALIPSSKIDTITLTGQAKDTGESPISGVKIMVKGATLSALTDNNGIYIISGIPRTSFIAEASADLYENKSVNVDFRMFSIYTRIITNNFILTNIPGYINIVTPASGENVSEESVRVIGRALSGGVEYGVIVNGIPAQTYNGYFMVNDIPLIAGVNKITAEMITPTGTLRTDSIDIYHPQTDNPGFTINSQEAGLVPIEIPVIIESSDDIPLKDYNLRINGSTAANVFLDGELCYRVLINEPGIYTFTFNAEDSAGNIYEDTFGFTGMVKVDVEEDLRKIWAGFKGTLITGSIEDALSLLMPDTRIRYREQLLLLGDRVAETFAGIGDIQLISVNDNEAKARIYEGDITHYVWFARDIYGLWKIHKF